MFTRFIETHLELTEASTKSACVLHHFIRQRQKDTDRIVEEFLEENVNALQLPCLRPRTAHRSSSEATHIRLRLTYYFLSPNGSAQWQNLNVCGTSF
jgi:hypothetical protein